MQLRQIIIKISGHLVGRKNSVDNKGRVLRISGRFCNSVCLTLRSWFSYFLKKISLSYYLNQLFSCRPLVTICVDTPSRGRKIINKRPTSIISSYLKHLYPTACTSSMRCFMQSNVSVRPMSSFNKSGIIWIIVHVKRERDGISLSGVKSILGCHIFKACSFDIESKMVIY